MDWDILLLGGHPEDGCDYGEHHDGKLILGVQTTPVWIHKAGYGSRQMVQRTASGVPMASMRLKPAAKRTDHQTVASPIGRSPVHALQQMAQLFCLCATSWLVSGFDGASQ